MSLAMMLITTSVAAIEIDKVRAGIEKRVQSFSTVDVTWKATSHFTRADSARLGSSPFGNETSQTDGRFPATFEWQVHLWSDGDKLRLEHARPSWMFQHSRFETPRKVLVFDGNEAKFLSIYNDNTFANQGIVRNDPIYVMGDAEFFVFLWHFRAFTYAGMLAELFVSDAEVSNEELDGKSCLVIRRRNRSSRGPANEHSVWLDAKADFAALRYARLVDGRLRDDHRVSYERNGDGHVLPTRWEYQTYDSKSGNLLRSMSVEVVVAIINQPIAGSVFKFEFPEGTTVSDQRGETDRRLLIGAGGREHEVTSAQTAAAGSSQELVSVLQEAERQGDWSLIVGFLAVLAGGLVACVFFRRLRQRRVKLE